MVDLWIGKIIYRKEKRCSCGKNHICDIEEIIIEEGGIKRLPEILKKHKYEKLCVVCDLHTEQAAGLAVYEELEKAGYAFKKVVYQDEELVPGRGGFNLSFYPGA